MKNVANRARAYILLAVCVLLGVMPGAAPAMADGSSSSYNYSYWGEPVASPAAYQATELWTGDSLGTGPLKDPSDMHVTPDGDIYVLDTGNNRILILDSQFKLERIIDSFKQDGAVQTFQSPLGLFVTENKDLYIADTGNRRVVQLDSGDNVVKVIDSPQSEQLPENFSFQPVRLVVDKAQRLYVMATGVYDGFMEFNSGGDFTSFIGANKVTIDPVEYFWKRISTQAQRSQMVMYTPTEFSNLDINEEGFIYATNGQRSNNVKKLNAQGSDILRRLGYWEPEGDIYATVTTGYTRLADIDIGDSEMYSILDANHGRVFTYNGDGYLLYVFGGMGNQLGYFNTPAALERIGDDFIVLDKALGEITVFRSTEYGRTLNQAVRSYYNGDEEQALQLFRQTINMNANLDFAYSGIGKAILRQGDYAEAMKYFKQSMDKTNYSKAYLLYRKQVLRAHFTEIVAAVFLLVIAVFAWIKFRKMKVRKKVVPREQRAG